MGNLSEPDLGDVSGDGNGGSSFEVEMVRLVLEEIRTAVKDSNTS